MRLAIGVAYVSNASAVRRVLLEVAGGDPRVLKTPPTPSDATSPAAT